MEKTIEKALSLVNILTIPQDAAHGMNMRMSAPRRHLASQQAYNQAEQLTNQAGKEPDKTKKLQLLRLAQDLYTQQGQYASDNAGEFSGAVTMHPLVRAGVGGVVGGAAAGLGASALTAAVGPANDLYNAYVHAGQPIQQTLGQMQLQSQGEAYASPLSMLDKAFSTKDYATAIPLAQKILTDPSLSAYQSSAKLMLDLMQR